MAIKEFINKWGKALKTSGASIEECYDGLLINGVRFDPMYDGFQEDAENYARGILIIAAKNNLAWISVTYPSKGAVMYMWDEDGFDHIICDYMNNFDDVLIEGYLKIMKDK